LKSAPRAAAGASARRRVSVVTKAAAFLKGGLSMAGLNLLAVERDEGTAPALKRRRAARFKTLPMRG
jgi:hypothetical protein